MKHSLKITFLLLGMFLAAQLIGIAVLASYAPEVKILVAENGTTTNVTVFNLPQNFEPPHDVTPQQSFVSIIIAFILALALMVLLMRMHAATFLRIWFFVVVTLALAVTFYAALRYVSIPFWIPVAAALVFAYLKIFKRNILVHNITEMFIYPGIAAMFVPLLNLTTILVLLVIISLYDMYAVWHSGFMQRMAHYQIKTLRVFSGFFIPYLGAKERAFIKQHPKTSKKNIKLSVALLGGGDIVFPMMVAGVLLHAGSLFGAILVALCSTLTLAGLFYASEKGKFYPAMPFISIGCFVGIGITYLL